MVPQERGDSGERRPKLDAESGPVVGPDVSPPHGKNSDATKPHANSGSCNEQHQCTSPSAITKANETIGVEYWKEAKGRRNP